MNRPAPLVSLLVAVCVLPAIASFRAAAQAQSQPQAQAGVATAAGTWALTGVRIADGSGNEPFEGTVVVRDGRIAEAGRSVRPPSDARVIDAHGRTVTTGLIDLQVQIPAGATDDQIDRALTAYAYAGVTTIAVSGLDPVKFDVVRERLQGKGLAAPRLVAFSATAVSGAAGLARVAPAEQRKATPFLSDFLPASLVQKMQADAGAGNGAGAGAAAGGGAGAGSGIGASVSGAVAGTGTAGAASQGQSPSPSAGGGAAASGSASGSANSAGAVQWQAGADKVKALRASNARLGIASGASEAGLPHGWSTLLEARLLAAAGVTPLQVMTAATSGGAWALSLQSDRAFIAVGQRADLVVFNGNPTSTIVDIERVERVFIGGQEVDRPALRTFLTREDAPPPAPPTPTETTAAANTKASGAAATRGTTKGRPGRRGAKAEPVAPATDPPAASATGAAAGAPSGAGTPTGVGASASASATGGASATTTGVAPGASPSAPAGGTGATSATAGSPGSPSSTTGASATPSSAPSAGTMPSGSGSASSSATSPAAGTTPGAPTSTAASSAAASASGSSAPPASSRGTTPSGSGSTSSGATSPAAGATPAAATNPGAAPTAGATAPGASTSAASPAGGSSSTSSNGSALANPAGASPTGATPGASAGAGSAPRASVAGGAATAGAAAGGAAAATVEEPLIDDFENNGDRGNLGAAWQAAGDPSTPAATIIAGRIVRGLRDHALHLTARMGDANQPFAGVTVHLANTPGQPVDVSRYRGIRFEARGEGRYRIVFVTRSVTDGRYHISYFSGSPLWTPVSIPFASLGQSHGTQIPFSGRDLIEISFQVARDPGQMGWLELDNLRFY